MKTTIIFLALAFSTIWINSAVNSQAVTDSMVFNNLVNRYVKSIDQADTVAGSEIWAHSGEVSFISPSGHQYGWNQIKSTYNMFRDNFTTRKLAFHNLKFANYGNVAWLEFYWVFDATLKANNNTIQTKGRETQIWRKFNSEWRLVHVHYSGLPEPTFTNPLQ